MRIKVALALVLLFIGIAVAQQSNVIGPVPPAGLFTVTGALKGNGSGAISQAACSDLSNAGTACTVNVTGPTAWTPSDQSGASLTFTTVSANYYQVGKFINANFRLTFPVTASGAAVTIGGLPVASFNSGNNPAGGSCISTTAVANSQVSVPIIISNGTTFNLFSTAGVTLVNTTLSLVILSCNLTYFTN